MYRSLPPGKFPKLVLETGRALIDEAGFLVTTIQAAKRLADGTRAYVADAGVNLLFTTFWYKLAVELDREVPGMGEHSVIYGPLCMNLDCIDEGTLAAAAAARAAAGPLAGRRLQRHAVDAVHLLPARTWCSSVPRARSTSSARRKTSAISIGGNEPRRGWRRNEKLRC